MPTLQRSAGEAAGRVAVTLQRSGGRRYVRQPWLGVGFSATEFAQQVSREPGIAGNCDIHTTFVVIHGSRDGARELELDAKQGKGGLPRRITRDQKRGAKGRAEVRP